MGLVRTAARGLLERGPVYAMVQVTARCNQRCRMCQVWTLEHGGGEELPAARYRDMAASLARAGVGVAGIAGEPFLRADLPQIVAAFTEAGLATRIQTNGTLVRPASLQAVLDAGLGGISISLHSLDPEEMDWLTGTEGALGVALAGAEAVADATRGRPRFLRVINMVLYPGNLGQVPAVLAWCREHGFRLSVIPIHVAPQRLEEKQFVGRLPPRLRFGDGDQRRIQEVVELLLRARRRGRSVLNSSRFLSMIPDFLAGRAVPWPCRAGSLYLFVDHLGQAAGCHELEPVGSVFDPVVMDSLCAGDLGHRSRSARARCGGCLLPCWSELSLLFHSPLSFLEAVEVNLPAAFRPGRRCVP